MTRINLSDVKWEELLHGGSQQGSGPIHPFIARRAMRGEGFGGVLLSGLLRILPMILGSPVGQEIVQTGVDIAKDVKNGESVLSSAKKHGRESIKRMVGVGVKVHKPIKKRKLIGILEPFHSLKDTPAGRSHRLKLSNKHVEED